MRGKLGSPGKLPARLWLWPNLLSLDAPVVAVLWQILFARCFQVPVDTLAALLLLLTVWLIYSADRTLDVWRGESGTPRHEFYRKHWQELLPLWAVVFTSAGWLALRRLEHGLLMRGTILLAAVAVYFAVVHGSTVLEGNHHRRKEGLVGILFALGVSLVVWEKVDTPADVATIILFSGVCWINCAVIQKWESSRQDWSPDAAALVLAAAAAVVTYQYRFSDHRPELSEAVMTSSLAFILLHKVRPRLSADALRVLADVALLSPLLFLPVVS